MTEDRRDGRMRAVGAVAAQIVLRLALESAKKGRGHDTHGVAGAGKTWADTQGGNCQGSREGARFGVERHRRHIDGMHVPDMASPPCRRVL